MALRKITQKEFSENPFTLFSDDWLLLTTENGGKGNTMTIGWGGLGYIWRRPVAYVFVRPERYTHELLSECPRFSLTAIPDKNALGLCGRESGRDIDKFSKCGFTLMHEGDTPYIKESRLVLCCKTLYADGLRPENFLEGDEIMQKWYGGGYHTLYIAEIESILVEE